MSKQTEAQRLAENLPALFDNDLLDAVDVSGAAAELLRQEALIAELAGVVEKLVAAANNSEDAVDFSIACDVFIEDARAALAKVKQ